MKHLYFFGFHFIFGRSKWLNLDRSKKIGHHVWDKLPSYSLIVRSPKYNYSDKYQGFELSFKIGKLKGKINDYYYKRVKTNQGLVYGLGLTILSFFRFESTYFPKGV